MTLIFISLLNIVAYSGDYLKSVLDSFGTGPSKSNLSGMNSSAFSQTWCINIRGKQLQGTIKVKSTTWTLPSQSNKGDGDTQIQLQDPKDEENENN